jgi:translocation protein SEC62
VKRALRAIASPEYTKAASKPKSGLPQITPAFPPEEVFKLLPLSLLALRVTKIEPEEAQGSKPKKRIKGQWNVRIEQHQEIHPDLHYVFLADTPSWKTQLYAIGALIVVFAIILFPLWPLKLRLGVYYISMGMLGLIALFFAMAIFRLLLFVATVFTIPPGLWLYPNLFEDVGFLDSFRPLWGWHEVSFSFFPSTSCTFFKHVCPLLWRHGKRSSYQPLCQVRYTCIS